MISELPFKLVLVSGAIRSGSTLVRALLATAQGTNDLARPSGFLYSLMQPYLEGLATFDSHAGYFFKDKTEFATFQAGLLQQALCKAWSHLGEPQTLVLGDPTIARALPTLHDMLPRASFAVVLRDPRAVVASRLTVLKRQQGLTHMHNNEISNIRSLIAPICDEYNNYYPLLPDNHPRVSLIRFEDVCQGHFSDLAQLLHIEPPEFDTSQLWRGSDQFFPVHDPWWSPNFGKPVNEDSAHHFDQELKPMLQKFVTRRCNDLYQRFYGGAHG